MSDQATASSPRRGGAEPGSPGVVRVRGVSKSFAGVPVLHGVGIDLAPGEVHAIIGGNGSGKSTLIKILAGVHGADAGTLEIAGQTVDLRHFTPARAKAAGLRFVHQQRNTFPDLTVAENLSIGRGFETGPLFNLRDRAIRGRIQAVLDRFEIGVAPEDELRTLRPAEQMLVSIARALQDQEGAHSGVLVLDEPTAALPPAEVERLLAALRRYAAAGQSIVFVSHRLDEVLAVADRVTALRDGRHVASLERSGLDQDRLIELIVGRAADEYYPDHRARSSPTPLLRVRRLAGGTVTDASFDLGEGEIVGLTGLTGAGCSTILRLLFGAQRRSGGEVELAGAPFRARTTRAAMRAGVALVPADRAGQAAFVDQSVAENIAIASLRRYWRAGWLRQRQLEADVARDVRRFRVRAASAALPISQLSGGNQQKAILARWLRREPRLILLDEPTQGVDVGAKAELWRLVRAAVDRGAGVLVASSDVAELAHMCDRVLIVRAGTVAYDVCEQPLTTERLVDLVHTVEVSP